MAMMPIQSFVALDPDGVKHHFGPGGPVSDSHWAVKRLGHLFEPADSAAERRGGVEQATAAPGEKRTVSKARSKKSG